LRHVTSSLRPAARSPDSASLEVLFPFSASSAVSPFLDVGQPRLLAVYETSAAGLPHPQHFRLQGFPPSWRFSPHSPLPVCFTRQALMGFRACQNTSSHETCCPKTAWPKLRHSAYERTRRRSSGAMTQPRSKVREPRDAVSSAPGGSRGSSRPLPFKAPTPCRGCGFPQPPLLLRGRLSNRQSGTANRLGFTASPSRHQRTRSALKRAAALQSLNEQEARLASLETSPPSWGSLAQQSLRAGARKPR
jgi:hypothetical protein